MLEPIATTITADPETTGFETHLESVVICLRKGRSELRHFRDRRGLWHLPPATIDPAYTDSTAKS